MQVAASLFTLSLVLASIGTWLGPLLAKLMYSRKADAEETNISPSSISIDFLIPAHNETLSLPATLAFIDNLKKAKPYFFKNVKSTVALSAWQGAEAIKASEKATNTIVVVQPGKWQALKKLVEVSQADWVAFVDAGVVWDSNTNMWSVLEKLMKQEDVMSINPTYRELKSGWIQRRIWALEKSFKDIENASGGPISLHGASIFYRRVELQKAFLLLDGTDWLNDDVVVPLTMRGLFPNKRIVYTDEIVSIDLFASSGQSEAGRRRRLLLGNVQWIRMLFMHLACKNFTLAALMARRISRVMWAWWFILMGAGFIALSHEFNLGLLVLSIFVLGFVGLSFLPSGRRLLEAFGISALFPIYFIRYKANSLNLKWK